jgi:hypothetical protein
VSITALDKRQPRREAGTRQRIAKKDQPFKLVSRPEDVSWLAYLPASEYATFEAEMNKALRRKDLAELSQLLISWRSTALIYSDPVLAKKLAHPIGNDRGLLPRPA